MAKQKTKRSAGAKLLASSLTSISLLGLSSNATAASDPPPSQPKYWEKCYGISRAWSNECGSLDKRHHCAGEASVDNDPTEWIWVPKGTCRRIAKGKVYGKRTRSKITSKDCKK